MPDKGDWEGLLKKIRALTQSARERVVALVPAWNAHLVDDALARIQEASDDLERRLLSGTRPENRKELDRAV
jgi:hypothetical protein